MPAGIPLTLTLQPKSALFLLLNDLPLNWTPIMPATAKPLLYAAAGDIGATATPNASIGVALTPILVSALERLFDCLFGRFGGGGGGSSSPAPALDPEESIEPLELAAGADNLQKADLVKQRVARSHSSARLHVRYWGGYKPATVRRVAASILRSARDQGQELDRDTAIANAIAALDEAEGMPRDELAAVIAEHEAAGSTGAP